MAAAMVVIHNYAFTDREPPVQPEKRTITTNHTNE